MENENSNNEKKRISPLKFYRRNWYYIGFILFIALSFFMGLGGGDFSRIQVILVFSFMAMLIHQFEEYAYPGGFPSITNIAVLGEKKVPDRYPINANQAMISNTFLTYTFYIIPVLVPGIIWLGLAQVMLGMLQLFAHGIGANLRLKSLYNPGLLAVVILQWPIGLYYIWYVITKNLVNSGDFVIGIVATIIASVLLFALPIRLLRNKESKYPFAEDEMFGFAKEKVQKIMKS